MTALPDTPAPAAPLDEDTTLPLQRGQAAARCFALVPCAGVGTRAGTPEPKQYTLLNGLPLVAHTLQALRQVPASAW